MPATRKNYRHTKSPNPLIFVGALVVLCIIGIVGITSRNSNKPDPTSQLNNNVVVATSTPESQQLTPTPNSNAAAPVSPSHIATLGDYQVEIKSAQLTNDYEGNPAIVITYSWTNNSANTVSSVSSVLCSAFQDGIGLETAIIMDDSVYDPNSFMTEVRPGTTIDVQNAFVLSNTTSVVEVEVGEIFRLTDDQPVAYRTFDPTAL